MMIQRGKGKCPLLEGYNGIRRLNDCYAKGKPYEKHERNKCHKKLHVAQHPSYNA